MDLEQNSEGFLSNRGDRSLGAARDSRELIKIIWIKFVAARQILNKKGLVPPLRRLSKTQKFS